MKSVTLNYRVGQDGLLRLDVPTGLTNEELEVTVTFQTVTAGTTDTVPQGKGWPPGFFEETFGSCKDDPIVTDALGVFDDSEEI